MVKQSSAAEFIKNCRDPFFFIEKMWGLEPQPCYPEFEEHLRKAEPEDWKAEWFGKEMEDGQWKWFNFMKGRHVTWQQRAILEGIRRSVANYGVDTNKISVKTGNGIGKSCLAGWLVPWFLFAFPESKVPCTAPTASQMSDVLWSEIGSWISKMPDVYKNLFDVTSGYIRITEAPESWYARARTARKENPEAFSGIHADYVMALADEASGVPDLIFEYGKGIATAPFWLFLMFSNPTRLVGHFKNSFNKGSGWRNFTFDSRQSPVVNWAFVLEKLRDSGFDSDDFGIFVKGVFPKEGGVDAQGYVPLFNEQEIELAQVEEGSFKYTVLGIDPAGEGNDKAAFVARNYHIAKIVAEEAKSSPKSIASLGSTMVAHYDINSSNVVIDSMGEGSKGAIEMAKAGHDIMPINAGDKSAEKTYLNLRAELFWGLRKWIKEGGQLVRDDRWKELLNLRYRYNEGGRLQIMSKEKMRKMEIPSPNFADALMLTFAIPDVEIEDPVETEDPGDIFD